MGDVSEKYATAYVRELSHAAKKSLQNNSSNADNVNKSSVISMNDTTGYDLIDKNIRLQRTPPSDHLFEIYFRQAQI